MYSRTIFLYDLAKYIYMGRTNEAFQLSINGICGAIETLGTLSINSHIYHVCVQCLYICSAFDGEVDKFIRHCSGGSHVHFTST